MNKFLIALAATLFAISTMLPVSSAQAGGFKKGLGVGLAIGAIGVMAHQAHRAEKHRRWKKRQYVRRPKQKTYVSKKTTVKKAVAKVEEPVAPPPLPVAKAIDAETENSSITTAALPPVEEQIEEQAQDTTETSEADVQPVAATSSIEPQTANKLDCKKFFPSVGMTLSVPCE